MRREQTTQTFKLQLLACVLALALLWYSLNPAPATLSNRKRKEEPPDEKKRHVEPQSRPAVLFVADEDEDDFEWPEYIDG